MLFAVCCCSCCDLTFAPTPVHSVDPPTAYVYQGEMVNLRCGATSSSPDWTYQLFHDNQQAKNISSEYSIYSADFADSGTYWCRIKQGEELSQFSNAISLNVLGKTP